MDAALVAGVKIDNVERFCREHGVTTRTFYRHRARIEAEGEWRELSRRPHHSPATTGPALEEWICRLRLDLGVDNGADFIRDALAVVAQAGVVAWAVPSRSTINRVLGRHDLLERNPAKRPRSSWRRFVYAQPRDCYQIDATEVCLADGRAVVVFDVLDDCTRMLVACHGAAAETTDAAITAITQAFGDHGIPGLVLSDNGAAFTHRLIQPKSAPSRFTNTVRRTGARLIHSSPYHPQTCGKVERHHQTLKKWLRSQPPPATLPELQNLLDTYRSYYNHRRHSALGRTTPHLAWTTAATHGGPASPPQQSDATVYHCRVNPTGVIFIGDHQVGIGRPSRGISLTAIRNGDNVTVYTTDGQPLGHTTIAPGKRYLAFTPVAA